MSESTAKKLNSNKWQKWMAEAQEGEETQYHMLLTELSSYLRSYVRLKVWSEQSVEEVIQEVLLSVHRFRHTYDSSKPFKPWFHAIVNSRIVDYYRRNKNKLAVETKYDESEYEFVEAEAEISGVDLDKLSRIILTLSDQQQKVIELLKFEGKSIKEVSQELNMSESSVKVTAHRGYKKICEEMNGIN